MSFSEQDGRKVESCRRVEHEEVALGYGLGRKGEACKKMLHGVEMSDIVAVRTRGGTLIVVQGHFHLFRMQ
jgi:hypothetical protein